jgi:hypothetical protein
VNETVVMRNIKVVAESLVVMLSSFNSLLFHCNS